MTDWSHLFAFASPLNPWKRIFKKKTQVNLSKEDGRGQQHRTASKWRNLVDRGRLAPQPVEGKILQATDLCSDPWKGSEMGARVSLKDGVDNRGLASSVSMEPIFALQWGSCPKARSGRRLEVLWLEGKAPDGAGIEWKLSLRLPKSWLQMPWEKNWRTLWGIKGHPWERRPVDTNGPDLPPSREAHPVISFWSKQRASLSPPPPSPVTWFKSLIWQRPNRGFSVNKDHTGRTNFFEKPKNYHSYSLLQVHSPHNKLLPKFSGLK